MKNELDLGTSLDQVTKWLSAPAQTINHAIEYCRTRPQQFPVAVDSQIFDHSVRILREAKRNL